ncbi:hypothetical protein M5689_020961 [Euphorbia peplus]|nr:hypothetical protein M5689_020961 [Euphorbia peplus]
MPLKGTGRKAVESSDNPEHDTREEVPPTWRVADAINQFKTQGNRSSSAERAHIDARFNKMRAELEEKHDAMIRQYAERTFCDQLAHEAQVREIRDEIKQTCSQEAAERESRFQREVTERKKEF